MESLLLETARYDCGLQTTQNDISGWTTPPQPIVVQAPSAARAPRSKAAKSYAARYSAVRVRTSQAMPVHITVPTVEEPERLWTCRTVDLSMPPVGGRKSLEPPVFPAPSRRASLLRKRLSPTTPSSPKPTNRLHFTREVAAFQAFLANNKLKHSRPSQHQTLSGVRRRASQYHFDKELIGVSVFHKTIAF